MDYIQVGLPAGQLCDWDLGCCEGLVSFTHGIETEVGSHFVVNFEGIASFIVGGSDLEWRMQDLCSAGKRRPIRYE